MRTVKEIKEIFSKHPDWLAHTEWYRSAIEWILKDIQESSAISVESIEKYLQDLLK